MSQALLNYQLNLTIQKKLTLKKYDENKLP